MGSNIPGPPQILKYFIVMVKVLAKDMVQSVGHLHAHGQCQCYGLTMVKVLNLYSVQGHGHYS